MICVYFVTTILDIAIYLQYLQVMKMEERAHRCYREASQLAHTSEFNYADQGEL